MKFKKGLENDMREFFGVTEMFYWGGSHKNAFMCLNPSNIVYSRSKNFPLFKLYFSKT